MGHGGVWRMLRHAEPEEEVKLTKDLIKRVARFAKPYRRGLLVLLFTIAIASFLQTFIPPLIAKSIINDAILKGDTSLLTNLGIAYLLVMVGQGVAQIGSRWISSRIGEGIIYDLRVALFDHVQQMPVAFFTRIQTGALISRLNSDVIGAQRAVTETTAGVVGILLQLSFALVGMLVLSPILTLIAVALAPLFLAPTRRMGKALQRLLKERMEHNAGMTSQMTERFQVGGALLVKLFGRPETELDQFSGKAEKVRDLGVKTALYGRIFFVLFGLVAGIGTALVYLIGGRMVIENPALEVGTLVGFTMYLQQLYAPITMLSNVRVEMATAAVSFHRVFEVLDFPVGIADKPRAVDLVDPKGHVQFDGVWFRYPKGSEAALESLELPGIEKRDREGGWVLKEVSFEIPPGKMVALVGPSGAGKTTITMLVPRLYEATKGTVSVDGRDVRDLTGQTLRDAIGVVTQDPHMFHDTLRNNLTYARPKATEEEIVAALKAAQIYGLVSSLPDGLDTTAGERGYRLSGGEKQRLAIARLLLKDPAIMILDEATAHLDSESEMAIQRALAEAFKGRSSLVIAHRLSTVMNADEILVVDDGRIVQRGTHFELLESGGLYEDLYRTQFERASFEGVGSEPRLEP